MKKLQTIVLVLLISILSFTSCYEFYYIENELHGMWQVTSIERRTTGEITEPHGKLYYSFQRTMVMLSDIDLEKLNKLERYIAHFDFIASDSIGMGNFRVRTTGEGDFVHKETIIPLDSLRKFGFYKNYTIFHMEQSKNKLTLNSDSVCIVLRRY